MHFDPENRSACGHRRLRTDWTQACGLPSAGERDGLLRHAGGARRATGRRVGRRRGVHRLAGDGAPRRCRRGVCRHHARSTGAHRGGSCGRRKTRPDRKAGRAPLGGTRRRGRCRPPHGRAGSYWLQPPLPSGVPPGARDLRERRAGRNDVHPRALWPRWEPRLRPGMARRPGGVRRRRADRPGRAPDRSGALVPGRFPQRAGQRAHLVLGHAGGGQRVPAAGNGRRPGGLPARQLDRVEESFLLRDGRTRGQARNQRPGRQLWHRAPHLVQNVGGDGTSRDTRLGISHGRRFVASRKRRVSGRHPPRATTRPRRRRRAGHAASYRNRLPRDRLLRKARMIITRSPLRISLGGGGTDLPSYYLEHGGFVLSAAIDKYVYITLHETFQPEFLIKYSATEVVQTVDEIKHPIIREALRLVPVSAPHLEIVSLSDIPAGTGLGSSGSFTVALLRALHTLNKEFVPRQELAEQACHIEPDIRGEPIGKQDQYISSFGGITAFEFRRDGGVEVTPLQISTETLYNLEDNLLLFFTGFTRSASAILAEQDQKTRDGDSGMIEHLHHIKQFGYESKAALEQGDLRRFPTLMH